jgi:hypothetical protein
MPELWKPLTGLDELEDAASDPRRRPQAGNTVYAIKSDAPRCTLCGSPIYDEFYRVNAKLACAGCGVAASSGHAQGSSTAFADGLLHGLFAAMVAMAVYAAFTIYTHVYLGYVAVAVGWLIGRSIMKGSNAVGGPRLQVAAAVLTYGAISLAAIPIRVAAFSSIGDMNWNNEMVPLALWGIASPILYLQYPIFGFVGLVLLLAGMRIAWRITAARRLLVDGPHVVVVS